MSTSTQWSELPGDLLHVVCTKVVGSLHRVRLAAVCRSWRAAAIASRHAAPPALPLLIYSSYNEDDCHTKVFCPEDGKVLPITLQSEAFGKWLVGGRDGGWVATLGPNLNFAVVNLFSGIEVALSEKQGRVVCACHNEPCIIRKVVFSETPTSSGCIIAAITNECGIALCRVGYLEGGWTTTLFDGVNLVVDIVFYNGELYGLTARTDLIRFEIGVNKHGVAVVTNVPRRLSIRKISGSLGYPRYIFELNGKLTMVRNCRSFDRSKERFFKVFELVDESTTSSQYDYKWEEVTCLNDHALFVGHKWSKAAYVAIEKCGGVKRNCIYADDVVYLMILDSHGNRVYEMQHERNGSGLQTIKSVGSYVEGGPPGGMWLMPPDF